MKAFVCSVAFSDGRCPDGCCGSVEVLVTSPTGKMVTFSREEIPSRELYLKLFEVASWRKYQDTHRDEAYGIGRVTLTASEMSALKKASGKVWSEIPYPFSRVHTKGAS